DVDLRAFAQVLTRDLAQLPEERHAVPFGLFLLLAVLALADAGGSEADLGNRHAALSEFLLGIVSEVSDENCFIDSACQVPSPCSGSQLRTGMSGTRGDLWD